MIASLSPLPAASGEVRVASVSTSTRTAVILRDGAPVTIRIDIDSGPGGTGAILVGAGEGIKGVRDELLVEIMNDWVRDDERARAA